MSPCVLYFCFCDSIVAAKLWSLRLASLARLRLTNQASAECTNLFAVLNAVPTTSVPGSFPGSGSLPPSVPLPSSPTPAASLPLSPSGLSGLAQLPGTPSQRPSTLPPLLAGGTTPATAPRQGANELVHPFELTVFHARVHYWSGDPLGYVDALSRILGQCKQRAREEGRVVAQRREMRQVNRARGGGDAEGAGQSERTNEDEDENEGKDEDKGKDEDEGTEDAEADVESTEDAEVQDEELDDVLVAAEANLSMWLERIARVCLILASQLIEMNVSIHIFFPCSVPSFKIVTCRFRSRCWHFAFGLAGLPSGDQLARPTLHLPCSTHLGADTFPDTSFGPRTGLPPLREPPKSRGTLFHRRIGRREQHQRD